MLRPVLTTDLPIFYEHQRDPIAAAMAAFVSREHDAFMQHWQTKVLADQTNIVRTIVANGIVVGHVDSWNANGERLLGYWIDREHWGRGIASSAVTEFLSIDRARPLHAWVAVANLASLRVLEKCGFVMDKEVGVHTGDDSVAEVRMKIT